MALPIAVSVLLGRFLDDHLGSGSFWTLVLLGAGIGIGALEAYLGIRMALRRKDHG